MSARLSSKKMDRLSRIPDRSFMKLIEGVEESVSSLDEKKYPVIQEVLGQDWLNMSDKVVTKVEVFISELLVVRPVFCRAVIRELVLKLNVHTVGMIEALPRQDKPTVISEKEAKAFKIIHRNLRKIFESFPMYEDFGVKTFSSLFPYINKGAHVYYCYVTNLLTSIGYMPNSKMQILHIIVNKLAKIDASFHRSEVEAMNEHLQVKSEKIKSESGGFSTIEIGTGDDYRVNPLVETLDVCVLPVFEYLDAEFKAMLAKSETACAHVDAVNYFKQWLLTIFEKEILPTFGTNHVQFLLFYAAGLHPDFPRLLIDFLWKKAESANTPAVLRIQAMSYISGLISRASYVSLKLTKRWITKLCDWANDYINEHSYGAHWATVNLSAHGTFYAVCQTLFYVVAFRNKELLESRKVSAFMRTLNLGRIITCDLNPLRACSVEVAEAFVEVANQHQISYCRTILDRNQRTTIPTYSSEADDSGQNLNHQKCLESFFPFEPYLLPSTSHYIDHIYRKYDPYFPDMKIEKVEKSEDHLDATDMDLSSSLTSESPFNRSYGKSFADPMEFMDC